MAGTGELKVDIGDLNFRFPVTLVIGDVGTVELGSIDIRGNETAAFLPLLAEMMKVVAERLASMAAEGTS